ncbi:MAG: SDR family oxidoreductase [Bacteroidales bacterium]|nr:SDR family oxidoreductase [Bacteroidales bacterium]
MKQKVVIVTGASSGIGLATAKYFASEGHKVVIAARNTEKLHAIAEEMRQQGMDVFPVTTDVTDENACKRLIDKTVEKYGGIDVLINNAGISMRAMLVECDIDVIHRVMNVSFWGTVNCTKYALPYIIESKGNIVGIVSVAAYQPLPARTGYTAAKFAIRGFLDTVRIEYRKLGVHVLIAAPGFVSTDIRLKALIADGSEQGMTPRDETRMQSPESVAKRIYKAVKHNRRSVVMSTLGFWTVLLRRFMPSFTDYEAYKMMTNEPENPIERINDK